MYVMSYFYTGHYHHLFASVNSCSSSRNANKCWLPYIIILYVNQYIQERKKGRPIKASQTASNYNYVFSVACRSQVQVDVPRVVCCSVLYLVKS